MKNAEPLLDFIKILNVYQFIMKDRNSAKELLIWKEIVSKAKLFRKLLSIMDKVVKKVMMNKCEKVKI